MIYHCSASKLSYVEISTFSGCKSPFHMSTYSIISWIILAKVPVRHWQSSWHCERSLMLSIWLVGCFEDYRRFSDLSAIYLDLEAGDNRSLKIQVARPGIEPRSSCSASQELDAIESSFIVTRGQSRIPYFVLKCLFMRSFCFYLHHCARKRIHVLSEYVLKYSQVLKSSLGKWYCPKHVS